MTEPDDQVNTSPLLGPLADSGGPTPTHAHLSGSTATDRGASTGCSTTDQRGQPRPRDGDGSTTPICDVGAYELQNPYPTISGFSINFGQAATNPRRVTLTLAASASATQMQFSNDGTTWPATWQTFQTQTTWDLTTGDGTKTVYARVWDANQRVSAVASDTIVLDTTATPGTLSINNGAASTNSLTTTDAAGLRSRS